jgi:hypothetical protein
MPSVQSRNNSIQSSDALSDISLPGFPFSHSIRVLDETAGGFDFSTGPIPANLAFYRDCHGSHFVLNRVVDAPYSHGDSAQF